ncbi:hypothetical protein [Streptomyces sp. NPDC001507]|uniref:hypothetical protein n=1 Tax=Streptomyces sp. NPDC001507 TaxID=3364579 RepID=UPI0036C6DAAF
MQISTDCWRAAQDEDTESKADWLAKKRVAEQAEAEEWSTRYRVPPLEGTDRAITWGTRCRHQLVAAAYTALVAEGTTGEAEWAAVEDAARPLTRAGWWLTNDLVNGTAWGRFTCRNATTTLSAVGGTLMSLVALGLVRPDLDGDEAVSDLAEMVLRMVGVPPDDAREVTRRPARPRLTAQGPGVQKGCRAPAFVRWALTSAPPRLRRRPRRASRDR